MIAIIAWRNVWRNKGRSLVVIGAMTVGIWALTFAGGFMQSFLTSYIESAIRHETSNGQVHHPEFTQDYDIQYNIKDYESILGFLKQSEVVESVTTRSLVNGMISSSRQATGVKIIGINPEEEAKVTALNTLISEGTYFEGISRNPVLIGNKLAEKLKVNVRSKVVLTFQDIEGNITAGSFRVAGILNASSVAISESSAYVLKSDLNRLLNIGDNIHEIAYTTVTGTDDEALANRIQTNFENDKVESWKEISPALVFMEQMMASMLKILIIIIMSALAFGIINTMLMAVLERIRELGMLMALGMKRAKVFLMIMVETIYLSTVGGPVGLFIGYATISYLGKVGIDLTDYSEGLEAIGYNSILYPLLQPMDYVQIVIGVIMTAFLASIYPAWKAIKLKPIDALHTI
ncbi:MAG: FtsX-like permease family protein [Cyclobacteriaceae bacterium]|nr:FtsX-like permease family protein [Cyclobacteriaceae bacterium]